MTPDEHARLRALVAQLKWEAVAARSAAEFARLYVQLFCRHTEAVSDCPHCNLVFLASYASRSADVLAAAELDALLSAPVLDESGLWDRVAHRYGIDQRDVDWMRLRSAPVVSPPTLYETASPEHRAIVDRVMQRVQAARTKAQAIGGGRSPTQEDDSQRLWACGCYEDQGGYHLCWTHAKEAAPVVTQEGESQEEPSREWLMKRLDFYARERDRHAEIHAALHALLATFRAPANRHWLADACADRLDAVLSGEGEGTNELAAIRALCLDAGMTEPSTTLDYLRGVFYKLPKKL
jgi:hypothetical protein